MRRLPIDGKGLTADREIMRMAGNQALPESRFACIERRVNPIPDREAFHDENDIRPLRLVPWRCRGYRRDYRVAPRLIRPR